MKEDNEMPQAHDYGEAEENDIRRDDHLEREFGVTGREFSRGSDRDNELFDRRMERESILFSEYLADRRKGREREDENVGERAEDRLRNKVRRDDRDGLEFRDAAIHSTAVGSLEGETASVGDEMQENTVDEEHPMGADKNA